MRFSPTAWAKLQYFCHRGPTEIGAFAIAAADDLLCIQDLIVLEQVTSIAHVAFEDSAVADYFDQQVDSGHRPEQFMRIWLHTHPGNCPLPSSVDEETFERVFGRCDWAVMFILARGGQTYTRLRFNVGPGCETLINTHVDYTQPFDGSDHDVWEAQYLQRVHPQVFTLGSGFIDQSKQGRLHAGAGMQQRDPWDSLDDWYGDFLDDDVLAQPWEPEVGGEDELE